VQCAEAEFGPDCGLCEVVNVGGLDDRDHRITASSRMISEHHDRLAVRRDLNRAFDHALRWQLAAPRAFKRRAGQPDLDW